MKTLTNYFVNAIVFLLSLACFSTCGEKSNMTVVIKKIIGDDTLGVKRVDTELWLTSYGKYLSRSAFDDGAYGGDEINIVSSIEILKIEDMTDQSNKMVWEILVPGLFDTASVMNVIRGAAERHILRWKCNVIGEMVHETFFPRNYIDTMTAIVSLPFKGEPMIWLAQGPDHMSISVARKYWVQKYASKMPPPF